MVYKIDSSVEQCVFSQTEGLRVAFVIFSSKMISYVLNWIKGNRIVSLQSRTLIFVHNNSKKCPHKHKILENFSGVDLILLENCWYYFNEKQLNSWCWYLVALRRIMNDRFISFWVKMVLNLIKTNKKQFSSRSLGRRKFVLSFSH